HKRLTHTPVRAIIGRINDAIAKAGGSLCNLGRILVIANSIKEGKKRRQYRSNCCKVIFIGHYLTRHNFKANLIRGTVGPLLRRVSLVVVHKISKRGEDIASFVFLMVSE